MKIQADELRTDPVKLAGYLCQIHSITEALGLVDVIEDVDDNFRAHLRAELQERRRVERGEPKATT